MMVMKVKCACEIVEAKAHENFDKTTSKWKDVKLHMEF